MSWFLEQHYVLQAFIAGLFTYTLTALGAGIVVFFKKVNQKVLDAMLGFAAGVMIAASFWSLLAPALDLAQSRFKLPWLIVSLGFISGGLFLFIIDKIIPHLHFDELEAEGPKTGMQRSILLVLAITLHNIPEGLAVGVAFGAASIGLESATIAGAIVLALGIGIQNFPEGAAVSIPLRREGMSRKKAFMYGQMSGLVEPIAAVVGALLVVRMQSVLPFALAFAAGAMIFVVIEELIPESQNGKNKDIATLATMFGFVVMMILDVALG